MSHSLATSTGTRVDSASKHIVPCKVSTDYMASLISSQHSDNPHRELQVNKHKYCMAKDDIVIGLGRPMYGSSVHANRKKAYPSVITTLGHMEEEARRWIAVHNFLCRSYLDSDIMKKTFIAAICTDKEPDKPPEFKEAYKLAQIQQDRKKFIKFQIENLMEFYVVGVSLGTAWAHPSSGDTVASVMIGGLRTVQNGAFPIHTNDLICIYFDDERDLFEDNGGRICRSCLTKPVDGSMDIVRVVDWVVHKRLDHLVANNEPTGQAKLRKDYYERGNGNFPAALSMDGRQVVGKVHVARIKPYIVSRHLDENGNPEHFPTDKARIFAKAISNAMPWEKVDICISRQAL